MPYDYDVLVVGAGSAGLSAALTLGRCLRRVLVADGGPPRNAASPGVHGFLSRDGIRPAELLRLGHEQLRPYEMVEVQCLQIDAITRQDKDFRAIGHGTADDAPTTVTARRVLLAKQLIHETRLPMAEVAMAAGFGSVRRFNETFQQLYGRPPQALRRSKQADEPMALRAARDEPRDDLLSRVATLAERHGA